MGFMGDTARISPLSDGWYCRKEWHVKALNEPKNRDTLTNGLKYLSLRAPEGPALSVAEGCVAIRHPVSLRGVAPSKRLRAGCAIAPRFLAEFTLSESNVLGMTLRLGSGQAFQVRLLRGVYTERSECTRNDDSYLCSWAV